MGWLKGAPDVPETISDKDMADLQRRAGKAAPPMFSRVAVDKRIASERQRGKADQS
jgi:hypothetical protein